MVNPTGYIAITVIVFTPNMATITFVFLYPFKIWVIGQLSSQRRLKLAFVRGFPVWERRLVTFPLLLVLRFILSPFMPKMATWHPTLSLGRDWQSQLEVSSPLLLCVPLFQFHSSFYHRFCNHHFILFLFPLDFVSTCVPPPLFLHFPLWDPVCLFHPHHHPSVIWSVELMALFPSNRHGDESCR